jgi:uncharacterized lipoprotein YmbA
LGDYQVSQSPQDIKTKPELTLALEVLQFESARGISATLEVRWQILSKKEPHEIITGHALIVEPVNGESLELLVAAHRKALYRISQQIASDIQNYSDSNKKSLQTGSFLSGIIQEA